MFTRNFRASCFFLIFRFFSLSCFPCLPRRSFMSFCFLVLGQSDFSRAIRMISILPLLSIVWGVPIEVFFLLSTSRANPPCQWSSAIFQSSVVRFFLAFSFLGPSHASYPALLFYLRSPLPSPMKYGFPYFPFSSRSACLVYLSFDGLFADRLIFPGCRPLFSRALAFSFS